MGRRRIESITGPELKALRRNQGMSQTNMASAIGCSRHAVSYWENKKHDLGLKQLRWGAPARMLKVLGLALPNFSTTMRARGDGVLGPGQAALDRESARRIEKAKARAARQRQICGATTRKGESCRMMSEPGNRRCKYHGGKSTGPRTPAGKAKVAEAQRRRWAAYRSRLRLDEK
ncbi:HGGxSTG domain-containing protein [Pseudooceanicola sp.]|uniref:HGGxSTG domain-containing protein n=1 Tax=Pseudooceanicola sp. TaxID=1914328 RepID=UPI003518291C